MQFLNKKQPQLDETVTNPRFAKIELTPSLGTGIIPPDVSKVGADLNDHVIAFTAISIQKHEIDKIKSDDRVQASSFSINNASKKIQRGMKLVEYMLQERFWFLKQMRQDDETLLQIISELHDMTEVENLEEFNATFVYNKLHEMKLILQNFIENFQRANQSILALDKRFLHQVQWRQIIHGEHPNEEVEELLKRNLMNASNQFYIYFKKKQMILNSIQMPADIEALKAANLSDEQIQKLIEFLEEFSDELSDKIPIEIKILCHLWIEDLIKIQGQYQKNLNLHSSFLAIFNGHFDEIMFFVEKTQRNINTLKSENENVLRIIKLIQMPQIQINQNQQYHIQAQQKLIRSKQDIAKIKKEILELFNDSTSMIFLKEDPNTHIDENERPVGEFPGAVQLTTYERPILRHFKIHYVKVYSKELEDMDILTSALGRVLKKITDMWVGEKKLRKAQNHFIRTADTMKKVLSALRNVKDYNSLSDQAILDLWDICKEFWNSQKGFQKNINWLTYYFNMTKQLQVFLPAIGDYVVMVDKFLTKANLLQEQGVQSILPDVNKIYDIILIRSKEGRFDKPPPPEPVPPTPQRDSDEEFDELVQIQAFKPRKQNEYLDDKNLLEVPEEEKIQAQEPRISFTGINTQLFSLTNDLLQANKGNPKIENIYEQKTYDNPYFDPNF